MSLFCLSRRPSTYSLVRTLVVLAPGLVPIQDHHTLYAPGVAGQGKLKGGGGQ